MDRTEPYWTVLDHIGPYRTVLDHIGPHWTTLNHPVPLSPHRTGQNITSSSGPPRNTIDNLGAQITGPPKVIKGLLDHIRPSWTHSHNPGHVGISRTSLNHLEQPRTISENLGTRTAYPSKVMKDHIEPSWTSFHHTAGTPEDHLELARTI